MFKNSPWTRPLLTAAPAFAFLALIYFFLYNKGQAEKKEYEEKKAQTFGPPVVEFEKTLNKSEVDSYTWMIDQCNQEIESGKGKGPNWKLSHSYLWRAKAKIQLGRYESGLKDYETAKTMPGFLETMRPLSVADELAGHGRYDDAVRIWEECLRMKPDYSGTLFSYGLFLSETKNDALRTPPRAVDLIKKSIDLSPEKCYNDFVFLARAQSRSGQFDEAREMMKFAIPLFKADCERSEAAQLAQIKRLEESKTMQKQLENQRKNMEAIRKHHAAELESLLKLEKLFEERKAPSPSKRF